MLDLSQLSKYKENNRIEAKKGSRWATPQHLGNIFGFCQHFRRLYFARRCRKCRQELFQRTTILSRKDCF